jgi:hypothetical protein
MGLEGAGVGERREVDISCDVVSQQVPGVFENRMEDV